MTDETRVLAARALGNAMSVVHQDCRDMPTPSTPSGVGRANYCDTHPRGHQSCVDEAARLLAAMRGAA